MSRGLSRTSIYAALGVSRQGVHQYRQRQAALQEGMLLAEQALLLARSDHPRLGLKKAYALIRPAGIGRDRFVRQMSRWGHALPGVVSYMRTTRSGRSRYPNLINLLIINYINRIWQSDTTYYRLGDRFVYITFIIEVYSRRILGYCLSKSLAAQANVHALRMALRTRQGQDLSQLIFHSDGAVQYRCAPFVALLRQHGISSSMCEIAPDNPYAEKLNDIIKNEYLAHYHIQSWSQLRHRLRRAVHNYNTRRPHGQLPGSLAPVDYEQYLEQHPEQRTALLIKDGQAVAAAYPAAAQQALPSSPVTWASEGARQILPAFVVLEEGKMNKQLSLDFWRG